MVRWRLILGLSRLVWTNGRTRNVSAVLSGATSIVRRFDLLRLQARNRVSLTWLCRGEWRGRNTYKYILQYVHRMQMELGWVDPWSQLRVWRPSCRRDCRCRQLWLEVHASQYPWRVQGDRSSLKGESALYNLHTYIYRGNSCFDKTTCWSSHVRTLILPTFRDESIAYCLRNDEVQARILEDVTVDPTLLEYVTIPIGCISIFQSGTERRQMPCLEIDADSSVAKITSLGHLISFFHLTDSLAFAANALCKLTSLSVPLLG